MSPQSFDDFLEHYGVLGMKWGVRRSQEELDRKAGRYKEKEISKVEKRYSKQSKKLTTKIEKRKAKGKDITKQKKRLARLITDTSAEVSYLKTASYADIKKERKAVAVNTAKSALLTFGSIPLSALTGFSVVSIPNSSAARTNYRMAEASRRLGEDYVKAYIFAEKAMDERYK